MLNKYVSRILIIIIFANLALFIYTRQIYFRRPFEPEYFGKLYSQSQYVIGQRSKGGIGDDGLYAFAGYYYLFNAGDVTKVNFEHPPLGKYLIGLSIFLFGNENIINLVYFALLLLFTYKLGMLVADNKMLALAAVLLLSADNLFLDNLLRSLLDLPFTLFFTGAVYFFLLGLKKAKYLFLSNLFWGLAFSTRFFPALTIMYPLLVILIIHFRKKFLKHFLISSLLVPVIYLILHVSFFVYHPSLIEFLRHKKWMLAWFAGSVRIFGNIWRNIFTGSYIDSTGRLVVNEHWQVTIPVIVALGLIPVYKKLQTLKHQDYAVLYLITVLYVIYVTVLTGGLQKFIMPVYPLIIVLAVASSARFYSIIKKWMKANLPISKARL